MMNRMFGFWAGWAAVGVLTAPDSIISIDAQSSEAQDLLCQLDVLHAGIAAEGGLSFNMESNMALLSLFMMRQQILA